MFRINYPQPAGTSSVKLVADFDAIFRVNILQSRTSALPQWTSVIPPSNCSLSGRAIAPSSDDFVLSPTDSVSKLAPRRPLTYWMALDVAHAFRVEDARTNKDDWYARVTTDVEDAQNTAGLAVADSSTLTNFFERLRSVSELKWLSQNNNAYHANTSSQYYNDFGTVLRSSKIVAPVESVLEHQVTSAAESPFLLSRYAANPLMRPLQGLLNDLPGISSCDFLYLAALYHLNKYRESGAPGELLWVSRLLTACVALTSENAAWQIARDLLREVNQLLFAQDTLPQDKQGVLDTKSLEQRVLAVRQFMVGGPRTSAVVAALLRNMTSSEFETQASLSRPFQALANTWLEFLKRGTNVIRDDDLVVRAEALDFSVTKALAEFEEINSFTQFTSRDKKLAGSLLGSIAESLKDITDESTARRIALLQLEEFEKLLPSFKPEKNIEYDWAIGQAALFYAKTAGIPFSDIPVKLRTQIYFWGIETMGWAEKGFVQADPHRGLMIASGLIGHLIRNLPKGSVDFNRGSRASSITTPLGQILYYLARTVSSQDLLAEGINPDDMKVVINKLADQALTNIEEHSSQIVNGYKTAELELGLMRGHNHSAARVGTHIFYNLIAPAFALLFCSGGSEQEINSLKQKILSQIRRSTQAQGGSRNSDGDETGILIGQVNDIASFWASQTGSNQSRRVSVKSTPSGAVSSRRGQSVINSDLVDYVFGQP